MNAGRLTLGCLTALCLTWGTGRAVADDPADATWTVVIKKVEVEKTKQNGDAWDINDGKPDLMVVVRNTSVKDSDAFKTKEKSDTYSADFDTPTTIKVRPGQTVEFEVVDVDLAANDTIGKKSVELKADALKEGKMKLEKFGQVILLEIELKKL